MEMPGGVRGSSRDLESQAELRERLYSAFKSRGLLTSLKTHVRDRVVRELRCPGESKAPPGLVESAALSLVAQHLGATACEYSLCLLYPESGLQPHAVLKPEEVLRVLGLSSERWAARTTAGSAGGSHQSLLLWLLEELTERRRGSGVRDEETQTSPEERAWGETLEERLRCIDREFSASVPDPKGAVGSALHRLELQVERRVREEVDTRVREFTERSLSEVVQREHRSGGEQRAEWLSGAERDARRQREELERSHAAASKLWRQRQEDDERALYQERQTLLREAEALRVREAQHKLHVQSTEAALRLRERGVESAEGRLRERETAAGALEETFALRLRQHTLAHEVRVQQEFQERTLRLVQGEERLAASDRETQKQLQELQEARSTITHLQAELAEAREAVATAMRKGEETLAVATRRGEEAAATATRRGEEAVAVATRRWEEEREAMRGAVLSLETELNAAREETSRQRLARQRDSDSQMERMSTLRKELHLQQEHNQLLERQLMLTAGGSRSPPPPPPPPPARLARSPSPEFLAETQLRVRQLELQALSLEEAYRRCAPSATAKSFAPTERHHHLHHHNHKRSTSGWAGRGGGEGRWDWDLGLGARAEGVGGERRCEERDTGMAGLGRQLWLERDEMGIERQTMGVERDKTWLERDKTGIERDETALGRWTTGMEKERGLEMDKIVMGRHNTGLERETTGLERETRLERETGTQRQTRRERETERQTGLERETRLERETGTQRQTRRERETERQTRRERETERQTGLERETNRERETEGQTGLESEAGLERQKPGLQRRMEMQDWDTDDTDQGNVELDTQGQEGRDERESEREGRNVEMDGEMKEMEEVEEVVVEEEIRVDCPIIPGGGGNQDSLDQSERSDRHDHIQSRRAVSGDPDRSDSVVHLAVDQSERSIHVDGDQTDCRLQSIGDRLDCAEPPALDQSVGSSHTAHTEMQGGSSSSGPQPLAAAGADLGVAQTLPESEVMNTYLQMVRGESQSPPPRGLGDGSLSVGSEGVESRDSVDTASHGDDDFW